MHVVCDCVWLVKGRCIHISCPICSCVLVCTVFTVSNHLCSFLRFSLGRVTPGSYQLVASHSVWDIVKVRSVDFTDKT